MKSTRSVSYTSTAGSSSAESTVTIDSSAPSDCKVSAFELLGEGGYDAPTFPEASFM